MFADLCPFFHQSPTKLCPDLVSFACWIVTEFWSFTRKSVPDLVVRALNCARFCVVCALNCARILVFRARLCPISFAPCPFPNLVGTLLVSELRHNGNLIYSRKCTDRIYNGYIDFWRPSGRPAARHPLSGCWAPARYHYTNKQRRGERFEKNKCTGLDVDDNTSL